MVFSSSAERDEYITKNMRLVTSRVIKRNNGIFDDDLFQEGCKALILAIDRFDENLGTTFSTYAVGYIDGFIQTYRNTNALIKPKRNGAGFSYKEIDSLDRPLEEDANITLGDTLQDDTDIEGHVIGDIIFEAFIESLKDKEQDICALRLNGVNQRGIGDIVGISQAQVSRILKRIYSKAQAG